MCQVWYRLGNVAKSLHRAWFLTVVYIGEWYKKCVFSTFTKAPKSIHLRRQKYLLIALKKLYNLPNFHPERPSVASGAAVWKNFQKVGKKTLLWVLWCHFGAITSLFTSLYTSSIASSSTVFEWELGSNQKREKPRRLNTENIILFSPIRSV